MQDLDIKTKHIFYTLFSKMQGILGGQNFVRQQLVEFMDESYMNNI
jgi:hypothetical protein